jgi:hypothetical protein
MDILYALFSVLIYFLEQILECGCGMTSPVWNKGDLPVFLSIKFSNKSALRIIFVVFFKGIV